MRQLLARGGAWRPVPEQRIFYCLTFVPTVHSAGFELTVTW